MEQRINGCWVNLENMDMEKLERWAESCQNAIIRAKEDLSIVEGAIAEKAMQSTVEAPTHGVGWLE